jgi:hypothetical protein
MDLSRYNALFYNKQAVANFAIHYMTSLLKQDSVVKERMEVMSTDKSLSPLDLETMMTWKDAINVPQRGS